MRNFTTKKPPSIILAIDSLDLSATIELQLSQLGCRCRNYRDFDSIEQVLAVESPTLIIMSLVFDGRCALSLCQDHPKLLDEVPVVFYVSDRLGSFEKALDALKLGALEVLLAPLNFDKIKAVLTMAQQNSDSLRDTNDLMFQGWSGCEKEADLLSENSPQSNGNGKGKGRQRKQDIKIMNDHHIVVDTPLSSPQSPVHPSVRVAQLAARIKQLESFIHGSSAAMRSVRRIIAEVADTNANVMIHGASGTGKELVATAVHKQSNRSDGPFEPVNITEIPNELAESLLFGHEKGSFTGADTTQLGVCEAADGGTLFLDEIGEMALATQPKLLRFLQEGTVKRIGSRIHKKVDVRVITATNRDPNTIVNEGLMREDLFFRLHVVPIYIPSLRERPEDIEQLAMLFLHRYVEEYGRHVEGFSDEVFDIFRRHDWPGNVRQLENVVERLVVFARGRLIEAENIPVEIHAASIFDDAASRFGPPFHANSGRETQSKGVPDGILHNSFPENGQSFGAAAVIAQMSPIQRTERLAIIEALQRVDGHVIDAANLLGLGQATVYRKIKQYRIPHKRRRRRTPK